MLRRSGILLIALLYLFTACGLTVNLHYCDNHIADLSINSPAEDCISPAADACAKPIVMGKSNMACRDSHLIIKVKDEHQKASVNFHEGYFTVDLPVIRRYNELFVRYPVYADARADRGPPDSDSINVPLFLKNCIFRI